MGSNRSFPIAAARLDMRTSVDLKEIYKIEVFSDYANQEEFIIYA